MRWVWSILLITLKREQKKVWILDASYINIWGEYLFGKCFWSTLSTPIFKHQSGQTSVTSCQALAHFSITFSIFPKRKSKHTLAKWLSLSWDNVSEDDLWAIQWDPSADSCKPWKNKLSCSLTDFVMRQLVPGGNILQCQCFRDAYLC